MKNCFITLVWVFWGYLALSVVSVDCNPPSGSFTIKSAKDVIDVAKCQTFTGDLKVAADGPEDITLDGINTITGNIDIQGVSKLRSLSSGSLKAVSTLKLQNLPKLSLLEFPALRNFTVLEWIELPALEKSVVAADGIVDGEIQEITIYNTALKSVAWAIWPVGAAMNISRNTDLESFTIPYNAINLGSAVIFYDNEILKDIDFDAVNKISGGLQLSGNPKLTELSFPALETIVGGFVRMSGEFANVSMPILESIGGTLQVSISGDSTDVSMPTLKSIDGSLQFDSTGDISPFCDFLKEKRVGIAHTECTSNKESQAPLPSPTSTGTEPTRLTTNTSSPTASSSPETPQDGISTGLKIGIIVAALIFALLICLLVFIFLRRRLRAKSGKEKASEVSANDRASRAPNGVEIPDTSPGTEGNPKEMMGWREAEELDGGCGLSELYTPDTPRMSRMDSWRSDVPLVRYELPG